MSFRLTSLCFSVENTYAWQQMAVQNDRIALIRHAGWSSSRRRPPSGALTLPPPAFNAPAGQDAFLIGPPGPLRRRIAMLYCELRLPLLCGLCCIFSSPPLLASSPPLLSSSSLLLFSSALLLCSPPLSSLLFSSPFSSPLLISHLSTPRSLPLLSHPSRSSPPLRSPRRSLLLPTAGTASASTSACPATPGACAYYRPCSKCRQRARNL